MYSKDQNALLDFSSRWMAQLTDYPQSEELHAIPSPCIIKTQQLSVYWQPILRDSIKNLINVEQTISLTLHPSAHVFYGMQYAGDMLVKFKTMSFTLIQVWNDDDFDRLEQNLIGHLLQQKKLGRVPTIFIATLTKNETDTDTDDNFIISINNVTGQIVKENLTTGELIILAEDLSSFLNQLS